MNDYPLLRPLLIAAGDPTLTAAVERYDATIAAQAEAGRDARPRGERRKQAEQARDAALMAAYRAGRQPTVDTSAITAADEADKEQATRITAAQRAVTQCDNELAAAVEAASIPLLHAIAVARAEAKRRDPNLNPVPKQLERAWRGGLRLRIRLAWSWGHLNSRNDPEPWIPIIAGWNHIAYLPHAGDRHAWNEHVWAQLAQRKMRGFTITDSGAISLKEMWTPPSHDESSARKALVVAARSNPNVNISGNAIGKLDTGAVVLIGTGPNGEPGVTERRHPLEAPRSGHVRLSEQVFDTDSVARYHRQPWASGKRQA